MLCIRASDCQGGLYYFTGNVAPHISVQASILLAQQSRKILIELVCLKRAVVIFELPCLLKGEYKIHLLYPKELADILASSRRNLLVKEILALDIFLL